VRCGGCQTRFVAPDGVPVEAESSTDEKNAWRHDGFRPRPYVRPHPNSPPRKWVKWAVAGGIALAVAAVAWVAIANSLPLDQGAVREKLSTGGFAFEADERSASYGDHMYGDAWASRDGGVRYYFRLSVYGHGTRCDTVYCDVFMVPQRMRGHNQRPVLCFQWNPGGGTKVSQEWAGVRLDAPQPPANREDIMVQFERLVNALR
jgi:hypothetical protein